MIISAGTIVSSLASELAQHHASAPAGSRRSAWPPPPWRCSGFRPARSSGSLCLWAVPYGLGAGSVDAALNNYVSLHYESRHMSWLHCMWGIGAAGGPVIMGWALAGSTWQSGYRIIVRSADCADRVCCCSACRCGRPPSTPEQGRTLPRSTARFPQLLKVSGVPGGDAAALRFYNGVGGRSPACGPPATAP